MARGPSCPHPDRVGPYKVLEVLGEGGMGVVYLAAQEEPVRRQVALKLIKAGMDTRKVVARFESERQALALMNHPNIATVYDAGATSEGRPYFVMEHVSGLPITGYCDGRRLSVKERLRLFGQVCEGIQHAHQKAIIHRDIKPSNILVMHQDGKPFPKVIDFGIAKATKEPLTEKGLITEEGQFIGTPEYMSPEQADPTVLDIDTRTDIYSLGVLLYQLLTGVLPFDPESIRRAGYAGFRKVLGEVEPPRPSTRIAGSREALKAAAQARRTEPGLLLKQLRGDLDWITMKAMEKDRDRRYATVQDLAADVRRHLEDDPVLAGPPGLLYRLKKLARKHRAPVAAGLALLFLAAAAAGLAWYVSEARFEKNMEDARAAIRGEDLTAASKALARLEDSHGNRPAVAALARELNELDRRIKAGESAELRGRGREHWDQYIQLKSELKDLKVKLKEAPERYSKWQPIWERGDETDALHSFQGVREKLESRYNDAILLYYKALEIAPPNSEEQQKVKEAMEEAYWERYQEAIAEGEVTFSPAFFKGMIESQGVGTYARQLEGREKVSLESTPPGAEVYCFRYENSEEHLVPIPFNPLSGGHSPSDGLLGKPHLQVERIFDPEHRTFLTGDRLIQVRGQEVSLRGDLARALKDLREGEAVKVKVLRSGKEIDVEWIPFPADSRKADPECPFSPGRVVDIQEQFGIDFAGYPLEFPEGSRVGMTAASGPVAVELPRGSYLLVFKKEGFVETRLSVSVPSIEGSKRVRLFKAEEVPEGFVHIPEGPFPCGGDREAYMSLEAGSEQVGDFFMGRLEVTFGDYLEFLNDPEVLARTDPEIGKAAAAADWEQKELKDLRPPRPPHQDKNLIQLIPFFWKKWQCALDGVGPARKWKLVKDDGVSTEWPVLGISMMAGVEYAHWITRKHGGRWRFRLPRDLEWEKAARGADRRLYAWGDYLVMSFCHSLGGICGEKGRSPGPVGIFPLDESIYGVRDMAGSVSEATLTRATPSLRLAVFRGGNWDASDPRDYRIPTRNRLLPENAFRYAGFRLVAEPIPSSE